MKWVSSRAAHCYCRNNFSCGFLLTLTLRCARDSPDCIADVIRHQQRALLIDRDANRPPHRVSILPNEASQHINRLSSGFPVRERDEDHLVTAEGFAIPGSMLPHEHAVDEARGQRPSP